MRIRPTHSWILVWFSVVGALGGVACVADGASQNSLTAVRFESGIDRVAFELRPAKDSVEVIDREGRLLVRIHIEAQRLVVEDGSGGRVAAVAPLPAGKHRGYQLTDVRDGKRRSELRIEEDGDLKWFRSEDAVVYKLKRRVYGFKIVDGKGEDVLRIRHSEDGRLSIRDVNGLTYLKTRDSIPVESAALLSIPGLSFPEASGLAMARWIWPEGIAGGVGEGDSLGEIDRRRSNER